jgi:hypothetical protein
MIVDRRLRGAIGQSSVRVVLLISITKKQEGFTKDTKQNKILRFARSQIEAGAQRPNYSS